MPLVVLHGGSRDGESTTVDGEIDRLFAASDAPGMVDVYEVTDEVEHVRGNAEPAVVFTFAAQRPIGELAPEMLHMPPRHERHQGP